MPANCVLFRKTYQVKKSSPASRRANRVDETLVSQHSSLGWRGWSLGYFSRAFPTTRASSWPISWAEDSPANVQAKDSPHGFAVQKNTTDIESTISGPNTKANSTQARGSRWGFNFVLGGEITPPKTIKTKAVPIVPIRRRATKSAGVQSPSGRLCPLPSISAFRYGY